MASTRIKYDNQLMKFMAFFESATHARLKDCFVDGNGLLTFVVGEGIALAIGRQGVNVRKIESALKRKVKVVEFSDDLASFVENLLRPLKVKSVEITGDKTVIINAEPGSRGYIIGRAASSLRNYEAAVKRYFDVKELRVA